MNYSQWLKEVCPSLLPPEGCPSIFPPRPHPPKPPKEKRLITDEICGNIEQNCNGNFVEYWQAIGLPDIPSATVSVVNKSDCIMTVRADTDGDGIPDVTLFQLTEKGQTKSATVGSINSLEISCTHGSMDGFTCNGCSGTFCISIHFEREFHKTCFSD